MTAADMMTAKSTTLNTTAPNGVPNGVSPGSLETYGITSCDMFPVGGETTFTNNTLTDSVGNAQTLSYQLISFEELYVNAEVPTTCGYGGKTSGSDFTLIYGTVTGDADAGTASGGQSGAGGRNGAAGAGGDGGAGGRATTGGAGAGESSGAAGEGIAGAAGKGPGGAGGDAMAPESGCSCRTGGDSPAPGFIFVAFGLMIAGTRAPPENSELTNSGYLTSDRDLIEHQAPAAEGRGGPVRWPLPATHGPRAFGSPRPRTPSTPRRHRWPNRSGQAPPPRTGAGAGAQ